MINDLYKENEEIINKIEYLLSEENHFVNVIGDFNNNPYIKYIVFSIDTDPVAYLSYYDIYDRYEIVNLYVLTNYRNKGIASSLLKELFKRGTTQKIVNITLEVNVNNKVAINLYKKNGFIEKAKREKYYSNENGILMEKEMI